MTYESHGKQVFAKLGEFSGRHIADATTEDDAKNIAAALNIVEDKGSDNDVANMLNNFRASAPYQE